MTTQQRKRISGRVVAITIGALTVLAGIFWGVARLHEGTPVSGIAAPFGIAILGFAIALIGGTMPNQQ